MWGKEYRNPSAKSGSVICEGEHFTLKRRQDIIGATNCICRSQIFIYKYIYINFLIHSVIVMSDVLGFSKAALMWENSFKLGWVLCTWKIHRLSMVQYRQ